MRLTESQTDQSSSSVLLPSPANLPKHHTSHTDRPLFIWITPLLSVSAGNTQIFTLHQILLSNTLANLTRSWHLVGGFIQGILRCIMSAYIFNMSGPGANQTANSGSTMSLQNMTVIILYCYPGVVVGNLMRWEMWPLKRRFAILLESMWTMAQRHEQKTFDLVWMISTWHLTKKITMTRTS